MKIKFKKWWSTIQSPLTLSHWTQRGTTYDVGNLGPGLGTGIKTIYVVSHASNETITYFQLQFKIVENVWQVLSVRGAIHYIIQLDFIPRLLKKNKKKLGRSFNFTFRYINDVLSLSNSKFDDFVDCIYPIELEIQDTTDTDRSASYLNLQLEIYSDGRLRTKLSDKGDDFNFPIVNVLFICSNIPAAPAYGIYIYQLIRYSRACGSFHDFLDNLLLTRKLLNKWLLLVKLKSALRTIYDLHNDLG